MQDRIFRVGTRRSLLALRQVDEILGILKEVYPGLQAEAVGIDTYGDKDKITPISEIEGTDFFTREIDAALLGGEVDFSVHSAKDLPDKIPEGLAWVATTKPLDPYDALVSKGNLKLEELPAGAKIGASSQRRKEQLRKYCPDFQLVDIRGNIQERLGSVDGQQQNLDAIIVAACALMRLGLEYRIAQRIPFEILRPHPWQGCLAIVAREQDTGLIELLRVLDGA